MSENANSSPASPNALRNTALIGGGIGLIGIGLAAGMYLRTSSAPPAPAVAQAASVASVADASSSAVAPVQGSAVVAAVPEKAVRKHVPSHVTYDDYKHEPKNQPVYAQPPAVVCSTCGVVASVRAVQQQGQGTGLGAVTGGVLGGVVGNQMGKGEGKAAMTLLGAIGGGLAGNEVEKRQRAETVYEVQVRMDDGSVRSFTQATPPAVGARVETDGETFHVVSGGRN